jgi:hypothetical protein
MSDKKQSQCKDCFAERARLKRVGKPCISCGNSKEIGISKGARLCLRCSEVCFQCKVNPREKQHRLCKLCSAEKNKIRNATPERKMQARITKIVGDYKVSKQIATQLSEVRNCEACEKLFTRVGDNHVDHCHDTGKVRGVLCFNCNAALGHLKDDSTRLQLLIKYLSKHQGTHDAGKTN